MLSHMKVAAIGISSIYIGALCVITIASIYDADGTQRSIIEYIQWIGISSTGVEDLSESWRMGDASSFGTMMCRSNSGRHRHQQHICCTYAIYYTIYTMERCVPSTSYVGVVDHLDESWKDGGRVLFCNDDMQFKPNYIKIQYRILTSQSTINRYWQVLLIFDCSSQRTCFGKF